MKSGEGRAPIAEVSASTVAPACARRGSHSAPLPLGAARQSATVALARLGARTIAYAADSDGRALHTFDLDAGAHLAVTPLDGAPAQLLVLADGRVAVAIAEKNRVAIFEPSAGVEEPLAPLCAGATAAEPIAIATAAKGDRLFVASGWGHALTVLETDSLSPITQVELPREPRAVVVDDDGGRAFVAHAVGAKVSSIDFTGPAPRATAIDLHVRDSSGWGFVEREGAQGYAIVRGVEAPGRLFVPMVGVDPGSGTHSEAVYGPANGVPVAPYVGVVDAAAGRALSRELASEINTDFLNREPLESLGGTRRACTLPRAAVMFGGHDLLVACQGIDALLRLDARARDPLQVERRRFALPAGPTGIAVDEARGRAVVWSQFAHAITTIALDDSRTHTITPKASLAGWPDPVIARGRALFHSSGDPRISVDARACASCHPDGRDDGLTWQTPSGRHQTIMIAGRTADAAPFGWLAARRELGDHVADTFHRLGGRGVWSAKDREDLAALSAYLRVMRAPSREGALGLPDAEMVARGQAIFEEPARGCASCHPGGHTDQERHDVKSGGIVPERFDTPSLRFVGGTAPYFHDGRYATLEELIVKSDGKMGHTAGLSPSDVQALKAYLESL